MARVDPKLGLLIPITGELADPNGGGTFSATFTEAGPGPGPAERQAGSGTLAPIVTGGQDRDGATMRILRGGFPGRDPEEAASMVFDVGTGELYAWQTPHLVTGFSAPSDYQADSWDEYAAAARSDTGELVVVYRVRASALGGATASYNPRTRTWTAGYDWDANQGIAGPISMVEDPNVPGRMILFSGDGDGDKTVAYYSDDSGATWAIYGQNIYDVALANGFNRGASVAAHPTGDWIMFAGNNQEQYYSSNHGHRWFYTGSSMSAEASLGTVSVCRGPKGFVVAYRTNTDEFPAVRVLPTAQSPFDDAEEILIEAVGFACDDISVVCDADGVIWAFVSEDASTLVDGRVRVYASYDGGYTWIGGASSLWGLETTATAAVTNFVTVASFGRIFLIGHSTDTDLGCVELGGWGEIGQGANYIDFPVPPLSPLAWVHETGEQGICYLPWDDPAAMGWTVTSTGTITMDSGGVRETATTVGPQSIEVSRTLGTTAAFEYMCGEWQGRVVSGVAAASSTTFLGVRLGYSATDSWAARIYLGTNGVVVKDAAGNTLATWILDSSFIGTFYKLRWQIRQQGGAGYITVWRSVANDGTWLRIANDVACSSISSGNSAIARTITGGGGGNSETVTFLHAGHLEGDFRVGLEAFGDEDLTPQDGVRGLQVSKAIPPAGFAYPVPMLSSAAVDLARVHGVGGPGYRADRYALEPAYQWPIEAALPDRSPNPRVTWRATDTVNVALTLDAGDETYWGGAFGLVAVNASFRTARIDIDNGAGGWTTIGTLDKGVSVDYTLAGYEVRANGSGTPISRYIQENELVGGYVIFANGGSGVARRITANTGGYWSSSASLQQVRIVVTGVDGTETATSTGTIVWPSAVFVGYPTSQSARRYFRVFIPGSQVVPADRGDDGATSAYDAGALFGARLVSVGTEPEWESTRATVLPATINRRRTGSPTMARTGPKRRIWSYEWGPSAAVKMRSTSAPGDYLASSSGNPIGTDQDAWLQLAEYVDNLDGRPVVLIPRLPTSDATLTDPSRWIYGLATSTLLQGSLRAGGWEGVDELVAVGGLEVEEQ